ncbi:MAG: YeeE/YedE thiosulfate transporter family protein [Spirochaetales bacterium]
MTYADQQTPQHQESPRLTLGQALVYTLIGMYFGIVLVKAEVVSWFRIQEMFHFQSIHMYGIIGLAVVTGALSLFLLKAFKAKSALGVEIAPTGKPFNKIGNPVGGLIFGFGWALTGACPGPLYALLGGGYLPIIMAVISAFLGVITYGYLRPRLPH